MSDHENVTEETRCESCIIRQLNALKALDKEDLKEINASKITKSIKKGEPIFKEGERLHGIYCVKNGVTKLTKHSENGHQQIIKLITKGEVLGKRSVIAQQAANLNAIAINDTEMCYIPKEHILEKIKTNPKFAQAMLVQMAEELRQSDNQLVNMSQKTVKQRIAGVLIHMEESFGTDQEGFLVLQLTREEIAYIAGSVKEACIRHLKLLQKEGFITLQGKRIKIINKKMIEHYTLGL